MRISRLELTGFKSFPDRTRFLFGSGVSCIVGPNGCGKSNIVDALKWCIGEMSPKSLRGSEMMDVIFAGSTDRKPVGFAHVSITFEAHDEPFPGEYAHHSEVSIGRRLHRNGTSEYLINQVKVRRKDVVAFFLDTGISTDLYAFIEQGKVDKVVNASPADRRVLIDEAAGISKYKVRRDEAQRRLEDTASQLDRAADVADEMGRRLKVLERQVVKAARFRRLRALIRLDELTLSLVKYAALSADRKALRKDLRTARGEEAAARRELTRRQTDLRSRREELDVVEQAASTWRDELAELDARQRELSSVATLSESRAKELAAERDAAGREEALATQEAEEVEEARGRAREQSEALDAEVAEARSGIEEASTRLSEADEALEEARAAHAEQTERLQTVDGERARAKARLEALLAAGERAPEAAERLDREEEELRRQIEEAEAAARSARSRRQRMSEALSDADEVVEQTQAAMESLDLGGVQRDLEEAEQKVERARAKAELRLDQARSVGAEGVESAEAELEAARQRVRSKEIALDDDLRSWEEEARSALQETRTRAQERAAVWRTAWRRAAESELSTARELHRQASETLEAARTEVRALESRQTRVRGELEAIRSVLHAGGEGERVADRLEPDPEELLHLAHVLDLPVVEGEEGVGQIDEEPGEVLLSRGPLSDQLLGAIPSFAAAAEAIAHFLSTGEAARSPQRGVIIDSTGWMRWEGGRARKLVEQARRLGELEDEDDRIRQALDEAVSARTRAEDEREVAKTRFTQGRAALDEVREVDVSGVIDALVRERAAAQEAERRRRLQEREEIVAEANTAVETAEAGLERAREGAVEVVRRQKEASEARMTAVLEELSRARQRMARLRDTRQERADEVRLARENRAECRVALTEAQAAVQQGEERLATLHAQQKALAERRAEQAGLEEERVRQAASLREEISELDGRRGQIRKAHEETAAALDRRREERDRLRTEHTRLEAKQDGLLGRQEGLKRTLSELDAREKRVQDRIEAAGERASTVTTQLEEAHARRREALAELETMEGTRTEAWDRLQRERERLKTLKEGLEKAQDDLARLQQRERDAGERVQGLDHRVQELRLEVEVIKRRAQERYQLSLPGMLDRMDAQGRVVLDVDPQVAEGLTVGNSSVDPVAPRVLRPSHLESREKIEGMVTELESNRNALGRLGEVNLAALEEYEELRERHEELQAQRDDLEASVQKIRSAISKMNRTCRERFRDAFDRVNEAFQEAYPRLVGGGSARLSLTNEEDLLETGVEIFVQPPGKRLTNLTLLSGGEKAMTAIALILALFKVKPSPFCVLDEVDAPLDEANGARFNEMLRDMSAVTQFLVITHNRKTMECADTLYGITMPTPGVSKLVTVDLEAHRQQPSAT